MKDRKALLWFGALLAVSVWAAFGRALGCGFVFDDLGAIVRNPSLHSFRTAWAPPEGGFTTTGRPLLNLSFAANYAFGGLNPVGYHAVNVLIHALAAVTLLALVHRTTKNVPLAFTAALLWALHPLQTESVAYVSQRAESLMGLWYLLTLLCLPNRPVLAVICCLLGMATKEDMASAPIIALLYDRTFLSGSFAAAWRARRGTHLALGATWLLLAYEIYAAKGRGGTIGFNLGIPYGHYLVIQASAITHYLRLALWPSPLIFDYGLAGPFPSTTLSVLAAVLVTALAGSTLLLLLRPTAGTARSIVPLSSSADGRHLDASGGPTAPVVEATPSSLPPPAPSLDAIRSDAGVASTLAVWFFAMLAPTSLVPGNRQTWAEHRMYLALAPLAILLACWLHRRLRAWALPAALALGIAYGIATHERTRAYTSNFTLWSDTVAKLPSNPYAQYNLGVEELDRKNPPAAAAAFRAALALNPNYAEAHNNLGNALIALGAIDAAQHEFATAVHLKPATPDFQNNLGNVELQLGHYPAAEIAYRSAIALDSAFAPPRLALVQLYSREGIEFLHSRRYPEAIDAFRKGVQLNPDHASARMNYAHALSLSGDFASALPEYEAAIRLNPQNASYHFTYGSALLALNRPSEARAQYLETLRLDPHYTQATLRLDLLEAR